MSESRSIRWHHRWSIIPLGVLIVLAFLIPNSIWNVLLTSLGGIYLISYVWVRQLHKKLSSERLLQGGWIAVGDQLSERFSIKNDSVLPALWVEITDDSNIPGYRPSVAFQVLGLSEHKWRQSAVCLQRGRFTIGPWRLRSGDPFGLFELIVEYPQTEEMIIHPPLDIDLNFTLPTGLQQGDVTGRDRAFQVTNNIAGVRGYQPLDPLNWIHWPSTARTGSLAVREFDIEAAGDAWVLIDLEEKWHTGDGLESSEEYAVMLASALSTRILAKNRAVGLATYGERPIILPSQKGAPQHWRILSTLAEISADGATGWKNSLDDVRQVISRGSSLILLTPNPDLSWLSNLVDLQRKQIKITVILLDRNSFDGAEPSDSTIFQLQSQIQKNGFKADVIQRGDIPLPQLDSEPDAEFKISPFGRSVRETHGAHD